MIIPLVRGGADIQSQGDLISGPVSSVPYMLPFVVKAVCKLTVTHLWPGLQFQCKPSLTLPWSQFPYQ